MGKLRVIAGTPPPLKHYFLLGYTISPPHLFFGLKKVNSAVLSQQ